MSVTIKDIAEKCGVSRGTVDRVLHDRGRVSLRTKALVLNTAREMGYENNVLGKALASRKQVKVIGVILCSIGNVFFDEIIEGLNEGVRGNSAFSIKVFYKYMKGYDVEKQLELMHSLEGEVDCLIINAIDDKRIVTEINRFSDKGIAVLTLNADVTNSRRLKYIGSDFLECGSIACGLIALLCKRRATVLIEVGSLSLLEHKGRINGFKKQIEERYSGIKIGEIVEDQEDDHIAYNSVSRLMKVRSDINAIFLASAGVSGVCRALEELQLTDITVVACDTYPAIIAGMNNGIIDVAIDQQPRKQGREAMNAAIEYVIYGAIRSNIDICNNILIYENNSVQHK